MIIAAERLPGKKPACKKQNLVAFLLRGIFGPVAPALHKEILFQSPAAEAQIKPLALCAVLTQPFCHS